MAVKQIESLLSQVSLVQKKYNEIAEQTGENFNIFRILKMETREVRTHSAFLAELFNPNGSHGQGDFFLKLFIEEVREYETMGRKRSLEYDPKFGLVGFQTSVSTVRVEFRIGQKTENEGGQLDILVLSGNNKLIIENKIYASDQDNQLLRYHNFDPKAPLYYLTLWEHQQPCEHSKRTLQEGKDFKRISYEVEILNWLEKCHENVANHALLRETIMQYIYLIRHLTNKSINNKMENELIGLVMMNQHSFDAYETLRSTDVRGQVISKRIEPQLRLLAEKFKLHLKEPYADYGGQSFHFAIDALSDANIDIGLAFYHDFYSYGFVKATCEKSIESKLISHLEGKMAESFLESEIMKDNRWPIWINHGIDFEMLKAIWEGKLGEYLERQMRKLIEIVRAYGLMD